MSFSRHLTSSFFFFWGEFSHCGDKCFWKNLEFFFLKCKFEKIGYKFGNFHLTFKSKNIGGKKKALLAMVFFQVPIFASIVSI